MDPENDSDVDSTKSRSEDERRVMASSSGSGDRDPPRSRQILDALDEMDTPVTIDELTDELVARSESQSENDDIEDWADVHEQLYVVDLPVLHGTGDVDFDASTGLVSLDDTEPAESTADPATADESDGRRWGAVLRILGLVAVSALLVGLTRVDAWPLALAPTLALAGAVVLLAAALVVRGIVRWLRASVLP